MLLFGTWFLLCPFFFYILGTCWWDSLFCGFTLLPVGLSWFPVLRQGHSKLGTPPLHSHLLSLNPFHTKPHPLFTSLSPCIGCLSSGLFCSIPCTDGRVRMTKTHSLALEWVRKMHHLTPALTESIFEITCLHMLLYNLHNLHFRASQSGCYTHISTMCLLQTY